MSRISRTFATLRAEGSAAYIPYICAGDPSIEFSLKLAESLCMAGADLIEIGLPFSDPIADGPVIQEAMRRSLTEGFSTHRLFELISSIRGAGIQQPIVVMSYFNPILQAGPGEFCRKLADAGGDGLLIVDLPPEESSEIEEHAREHDLDLIRLIAPSTDDARLDLLFSKASGFVYIVSVAGTTGARNVLTPDSISTVSKVRSRSPLPVALGFGISRSEHVQAAVAAGADGVVEGSQLVSLYSGLLHDERSALSEIEKHAAEMKAATNLQNG